MQKIKVLVVDDSAFMRRAIATMLGKDKEIEVVATARNGEEALEFIKKYNPDLVTLDIEMPVMDGLTALEKIIAGISQACDYGKLLDHRRSRSHLKGP